ncbi:hypothetical protein J4207_02525 [Candidatus Woesearchaeota archaeon]|nr:hypothetical protein [Candidatus Woesearchaeota archaeon]
MAEHVTSGVKQCIDVSWEASVDITRRLRKKAGTWQGSTEIKKWRA